MSFFHILSKRSFLFVWLISVYTAQALSTNDGGVLKLNLHRRQLNSNKKASVDVLLDDVSQELFDSYLGALYLYA